MCAQSHIQTPAAATSENEDLVDKAYGHTLKLISRPALLPSLNLSIPKIAKELGMSRTPVRLALERLRAEGLVQYDSEDGWTSVPITLADLEEILDLRAALAALRAQKATQNITPETAAELMRIIAEMERAEATNDMARWLAADQKYHAYLTFLARNKRLTRMLTWLESQWYRTEVAHMALERDVHFRNQEHRAIAEAICAGDGDAVKRLLQAHSARGDAKILQTLRTVVLPYLQHELPESQGTEALSRAGGQEAT